MTIQAIGRYDRGHGHRWIVLFEGSTEEDARDKMYAFVGKTGSALTEFADFPPRLGD